MTDRPFYPAGSSIEPLGHFGIEDLGHRIDHVHIPDRDQDGLPQILIAFDVGGHSHLVDDGRDLLLQIDAPITLCFYGCPTGEVPNPLTQGTASTGLHHKIVSPLCRSGIRDPASGIIGQHQDLGAFLHLVQLFQHLQAVQARQHNLHHHRVRHQLAHHTD